MSVQLICSAEEGASKVCLTHTSPRRHEQKAAEGLTHLLDFLHHSDRAKFVG